MNRKKKRKPFRQKVDTDRWSVFRWSILVVVICFSFGIFVHPFSSQKKLQEWFKAISGPLAFIFIALEINQTYDKRKREEDREYRDLERLQNYLEQMIILLVEEKLAEQEHDSVTAQAASALTVAVIKTLSKDGIQQVLNFQKAAGLSGKEKGPELLQNTDLQSLNLTGMDLRQLNLRGADLRGAYLNRADLRGANLYRANLIRANLRGANLYRAHLIFAKFHKTTVPDGTIRTDEK